MEDIDGGLHPAVDGQSLDETRRERTKEEENGQSHIQRKQNTNRENNNANGKRS